MIADRPELCGFVGTGRVTHAGVVSSGFVAFAGPYLLLIHFAGTAGSEVIVRATLVGAIGCWLVMSAATVTARGGPLLNTVFYPAAIVACGPPLINAIAIADATTLTHSYVPLFSARWTWTVISTVVPGITVGFGLLAVRFGVLMDSDERWCWAERHLPAAFRAEFIEGPRRRLEESAGRSCRDR